MNKIYKIVWSKAKHAYVVTSEVARSHTKSASGKAVKAVLAATVGMGVLMGGYAADAAPATNPAGNGPGIAIGTGSSAPKVENVAIGQGAGIGYSNGASAATGDVAIGNGANINNYASQGGSIAIGKNAKVENMAGGGEASFAFGQTTFSGSWLSLARIPADPGDGHAIYTINAKDTVVTGGTATYASNGTGSATLINNDGTTATITGLKDRYTSSASLSGDTLNFTRNDGSTYSVSGIASSQDIKNVTNKVGELGTRVNRAGAGAAALAALHPLDFDPDDKWDVAAGYGNYKDAHAVSVGAFYRPNEDTMFSVGGSFGGGENMVNAGVSVKLGQGNHVSTSRVALAREVEDLKAIVKAQSAEIKAMRGAMQSGASVMKDVDFPDVPKDHWAYSYVKSLADRGLLEGYPDGEFKGDRSMTRYEFAAIIYRALQNGAPIDGDMAKAIGEFEPEINRIKDLDRTRVDRISGKDNDRHKVERVRVNNESNKETGDYRDVYGSHISPEA